MPYADQQKIQQNNFTNQRYNYQQVGQQSNQQQQVTGSDKKFHSELSLVSFILGILGLIVPFFSTLAIIMAIGGLMQVRRSNLKGKWMSVTGMILGIIGILFFITAILFGISLLQEIFSTDLEEIISFMNKG
tara:strand:- start:326 stop:721 length:396 start_codon:yes stop_codon:yes gene_type:complete